jgi:hypothetical protein
MSPFIEERVPGQENKRSYICVIGVSNFLLRFWDCSESVVFFCFSFYVYININKFELKLRVRIPLIAGVLDKFVSDFRYIVVFSGFPTNKTEYNITLK